MELMKKKVTCDKCGYTHEEECGFCCDYCKLQGAEKDFPIKITKHTYWGNDTCESYQTAHYCNFEHFILDTIKPKSDFWEHDEIEDKDWSYEITTSDIPFKELLNKLQKPVIE